MTRLQLHTCVLLASLSSARHRSEHEGLGRTLSFLSHDSVHSWARFSFSVLVIAVLEGHSVSSDQHMKKFMSLREGLHVMMQCYMRQHFAVRYWLHEHPGGHASWSEPTVWKFTKESTTYFVERLVCRWTVQKMRSKSSEFVRKPTGSSQTVGESK